jgi:pyruvate carboxylase
MDIKLALVAAAVALTPVASFADDHTIHGRSEFALTASLAEKGIDAERVEEWGTAIRVDVRNADESNGFILVDKDTLQPLNSATAVGTRIDLGNTGSGWSAADFNSSTESLTE